MAHKIQNPKPKLELKMVAYSPDTMFSHSRQELTLSSMPLVPAKKVRPKVRLHYNFTRGKYAVLCGRGSKCTKSAGNQRLREIVKNNLTAYSAARNKVEKTAIVSYIIDTVKQAAPGGAFLKFEDDCWWEVDDSFAREKIGCLFRDSLHMQYKSSTKAKLARKNMRAATSRVTPAVNEEQRSFTLPPTKHSLDDMLGLSAAFKTTGGMKFKVDMAGQGRFQPRSDFLRDCMSHFEQAMRSQAVNTTSKDQLEPNSVLRQACSIIGGPTDDDRSNRYNLENGDLPDDLSDISDIFDDDELLGDDDDFNVFEQETLVPL
jgi:hypothetical protein